LKDIRVKVCFAVKNSNDAPFYFSCFSWWFAAAWHGVHVVNDRELKEKAPGRGRAQHHSEVNVACLELSVKGINGGLQTLAQFLGGFSGGEAGDKVTYAQKINRRIQNYTREIVSTRYDV